MISESEQTAFVRAVGLKPAAAMIKAIDDLRPFIEAAESELGQQFLKEDVEELTALINELFDSLINVGTAEQEKVIKLRLLYGRVKRTAVRLKSYHEKVEKVKNCQK